MRRLFNVLSPTIAFMLATLVSTSVCGQVSLTSVPWYLPAAERVELIKLRKGLSNEREKIQALMDEHSAKQVPKDTPAAERLRLEGVQLREKKFRHLEASKKFNEAVAATEKAFRTAPEYAATRQKLLDTMLNSTDYRNEPIVAPLVNNETNRSAYNYMKVIEQFKVRNEPESDPESQPKRYQPEVVRDKDGNPVVIKDQHGNSVIDEKTGKPIFKLETWCNVYARDVAWAMGAELPAKMTTSQMLEWLNKSEKGWHIVELKAEDHRAALDQVSSSEDKKAQEKANEKLALLRANEAQKKANEGLPTIAIVSGHIAVLRPGSSIEKQNPKDQARGPAIAQAGKKVLDAKHLSTGFMREQFEVIQYWYHD